MIDNYLTYVLMWNNRYTRHNQESNVLDLVIANDKT